MHGLGNRFRHRFLYGFGRMYGLRLADRSGLIRYGFLGDVEGFVERLVERLIRGEVVADPGNGFRHRFLYGFRFRGADRRFVDVRRHGDALPSEPVHFAKLAFGQVEHAVVVGALLVGQTLQGVSGAFGATDRHDGDLPGPEDDDVFREPLRFLPALIRTIGHHRVGIDRHLFVVLLTERREEVRHGFEEVLAGLRQRRALHLDPVELRQFVEGHGPHHGSAHRSAHVPQDR